MNVKFTEWCWAVEEDGKIFKTSGSLMLGSSDSSKWATRALKWPKNIHSHYALFGTCLLTEWGLKFITVLKRRKWLGKVCWESLSKNLISFFCYYYWLSSRTPLRISPFLMHDDFGPLHMHFLCTLSALPPFFMHFLRRLFTFLRIFHKVAK